MPSDFKPMFDVGAGVYEIRLHVLGEWRVLYIAKKADAVYVLHAFQKRRKKHDVKTLILLPAAIIRLEDCNHERRNHRIVRERVC